VVQTGSSGGEGYGGGFGFGLGEGVRTLTALLAVSVTSGISSCSTKQRIKLTVRLMCTLRASNVLEDRPPSFYEREQRSAAVLERTAEQQVTHQCSYQRLEVRPKSLA